MAICIVCSKKYKMDEAVHIKDGKNDIPVCSEVCKTRFFESQEFIPYEMLEKIDKVFKESKTAAMTKIEFKTLNLVAILERDGADKNVIDFIRHQRTRDVFTVYYDNKVTILIFKGIPVYAILTFKEDTFNLKRALHICVGRLMKQMQG